MILALLLLQSRNRDWTAYAQRLMAARVFRQVCWDGWRAPLIGRSIVGRACRIAYKVPWQR